MARARALPIYPTTGEVHAMLAAARTPRDQMLLKLLWHTGGRISEVLSIRVGDFTDRGIRMANLKQGSGSAEKHVFLDPAFLAEARDYCRGKPRGAYLIGRYHDGGRLTRQMAWHLFKAIALRAGVIRRRMGQSEYESIWPHTMRHGYAVNTLGQGVPINAVQGQLGHANLDSTAIYLQLADADRERAIAGLKF